MRSWTSRSEVETERLGEELGRELQPDGVLLLYGDLGAGKTVLVRGVARALGVEPREVQSPTYALIHEYAGRLGRLVHVDLYRLEPEELEALGLWELLAGHGVKVVEWAERLTGDVPGALQLEIRPAADGSRVLRQMSSSTRPNQDTTLRR